MPIIDYHCHLIPQMVAENKRFESIAQIWLMGDHYKWRAMRSNGVDERYCTGKDTTDWEKFEKWAETVPYTFRNPLYHWTHLELKTAFGIEERLNPETARAIYDKCNDLIANDPKFCPRGLMKHYGVELVCTTDDPADSLEWHKVVKDDPTAEVRMLPTWRPDAGMNIEAATWKVYIEKLAGVAGMEKQMMALSNLGLLSRLVGMLTDSRSFLSYPRHEYFRRTLCNILGNDIENGMIPYTGYEKARVQQMVEDICYNNAKNYFKF